MFRKSLAIAVGVMLLANSVLIGCASDAWKENTGTIDLTKMSVTGEGIEVLEGEIKITKGGDFTVTGENEDSMIYINTDEKVKLRLSGMSLTNPDGPAIYFDNADKALITIEKGTENYLKDGENYSVEDADAVLFSNDDMEIKGGGTLYITALYKHGIGGDDDVVIENGNIFITAAKHGIKANDLLNISYGNFDIMAQTGKGLKADKEVLISGGTFKIVSKADEGIESEGTLTISGGNIDITSKSDGLNTGAADIEESTGAVTGDAAAVNSMGGGMQGDARTDEEAMASAIKISGGKIYISTEEDGIDSNGSLTISGGEIIIDGPVSSGNGSIDYARGFDITGGKLIATSSMGMVSLPGTLSQNTVKVGFSAVMEAESEVVIKSGDTEILNITPKKEARGLIFSSDMLETGKTYTLYINGAEEASFTVEASVTTVGTVGGMGGGRPGGMGGGMHHGDRFPEGMTPPENMEAPEGMKRPGGMRPGRNSDRISVTLDGKELLFNTDPVIKNSTTLVGFRAILEALGATVTWDSEKRCAIAEKEGIRIELYIDSVTAYVNGEAKQLLTAPEIINDSTMIPVRFVSENLGMKVDWDEAARRVIIEKEV